MAVYTDFKLNSDRETLSSISVNEDEVAINNALKNIFSTPLGSLHGKPRFGTRIFQLLFSQMDIATEIALREMIKEEILKFEPRVVLRELKIKNIPEYNKIVVDLYYTYKLLDRQETGTTRVGFNY